MIAKEYLWLARENEFDKTWFSLLYAKDPSRIKTLFTSL